MDDAFDVAVVGAGIVGASVAAAASRAGYTTVLLERQKWTPTNATMLSGGLVRGFEINAANRESAVHGLYGSGGLLSDPTLTAVKRVGAVVLGVGEDDARDFEAMMNLVNAPVELLRSSRQLSNLGFDAAGRDLSVWEPAAGVVVAPEALRQVVREALMAGALVLHEAAVIRLSQLRSVVRLYTGSPYLPKVKARTVIIAIGAWGSVGIEGVDLPYKVRTKAIQTTFVTRPRDCSHPAFFDEVTRVYGAPVNDELSMVGLATDHWDGYPAVGELEAADPEHSRETIERAMTVLPWLRRDSFAHSVRGFDGYVDGNEREISECSVEGVYAVRPQSGSGMKTFRAVASTALNLIGRR